VTPLISNAQTKMKKNKQCSKSDTGMFGMTIKYMNQNTKKRPFSLIRVLELKIA
jgi:hypothetical protein